MPTRRRGESILERRRPFALALVAISGLPLSACTGGFFPAPVATDSAPSASAGPRAPFLKIGPIKWSRGAETAVVLAADGTLSDHGLVLGKLTPEGVFTSRGGARTFTMSPDGTVHVATGFEIRIDADGTAVTRVHGQPDEALTLAQATSPRGNGPPLSVEGADLPLRRTAMFVLMIPDLMRIQPDE
ncbi:MAG: hypothetical protein U0441_05995 [Polyangiaceae bacterium]